MSELISGKEAKLAWANAVDVQYLGGSFRWQDIASSNTLNIFDREDFKFRLKPRTITLNGIKIPTPFEPLEGEIYWYIVDNERGYNYTENLPNYRVSIAAWRNEGEIKQVVAALRSVFNIK